LILLEAGIEFIQSSPAPMKRTAFGFYGCVMRICAINWIVVGVLLANCLGGHAADNLTAPWPEARSEGIATIDHPCGANRSGETCGSRQIEQNFASPMWDSPAETTRPGLLEIDSITNDQFLEHGVHQRITGTTARYGLSGHVELRWVLPGMIVQRGGGSQKTSGTTDQWIGACWRFYDQTGTKPDMALDYAIKFPTANPSKAFGSGYIDNQLAFIASRDLGLNHLDFNAVGTIARGRTGTDGGAQFGLALTRKLSRRLLGTLETFGGSQPGTFDCYSAWLWGGAWSIKPSFSLSAAYSRAYTAGSPREQYLFGFIYTMRPQVGLPKGFAGPR
jgi:hypothetical protein